MELYELKTNERIVPLGLDGIPYFSWKIRSGKENVRQVAFRIQIEGMWDTGRVESREQAFIEYEGAALLPCTQYQWKVTVWNNYGEEAKGQASFETAMIQWKAAWAECSIKREPGSGYSY